MEVRNAITEKSVCLGIRLNALKHVVTHIKHGLYITAERIVYFAATRGDITVYFSLVFVAKHYPV